MVQVTQKIEPQIVILAGGLGTRLRPITEQIPKAMVPILDKPFVHYQLDRLAHQGISDVILSIGYLGHQIADYVQDGQNWGIKVRYTQEGQKLLGTAGALRLVSEHGFLKERFLVTYGDSFLPIDFRGVWDTFLERKEPALMTVYKNQGKWDQSNACFDGSRVVLYDKKIPPPKPPEMQYIDYGLSALSRRLIQAAIPREEPADLAELFHQLSTEGKLAGVEVQERFYEVGSMSGVQDLENHLREQQGNPQV
jgi:NDP-sugar pyrophosphorylase family protein